MLHGPRRLLQSPRAEQASNCSVHAGNVDKEAGRSFPSHVRSNPDFVLVLYNDMCNRPRIELGLWPAT